MQKRNMSDPAPFTWFVDSDGYDLTEDRTRIRRRGGTMDAYTPDGSDVPPHHVLADGFEPYDPNLDSADAALMFVRRFGFLGAADRDAGSPEESVDWISTQRTSLSAWRAFYVDTVDKERAQLRDFFAKFNRSIPGHFSIGLEHDRVGNARITIVPRTLLSWCWLATAREATGESTWRQCEYPSCSNMFQVGRDQKTSRRLYCCDTHRTLGNRLKKSNRGR